MEDTVTYTELGKIIPVDEYGTPIENAPTPSYNNDPEDPTMAMETVVPDVLGYISKGLYYSRTPRSRYQWFMLRMSKKLLSFT
ncbi:MAG: hypothetical protein ACLS5G_06070 [Streptococcus sp.]